MSIHTISNKVDINTSEQIISVLKQYWGYSQFRPQQKEAVECVLQYKDSIVVLPTGGGKSICFQAPAVVLPGMAIVISPLISLMKDQVDALSECGIPAARLDSTLHPMEVDMVFEDIQRNKLKLLYISPERLFSDGFLNRVKTMNVSFMAVDEAHCVSSWGHDFRPEYRQLGKIKDLFPELPVHAYTATATHQVREDISFQLKLNKPEIVVGSFDRPNLNYKLVRRESILTQVTEVINRHPNESGIIYCIRRADVDGLCSALKQNGINVLPYHAGLNDSERKRNQDAFIKEEVDIIVATVAFGMGIDKSNVRYVIHTGMPKSLENYQQESGRAGRDGLESECCLFYSGSDFGTWKSIMRSVPDEAKKNAEKKLSDIYDFCTGVVCRHQAIVSYFGQRLEKENCYACDVCLGEMNYVKEAKEIAQKILSCIKRLNEQFGAAYTAAVLTGSKEQRILANQHNQLSTYGILSDVSKRVVHDWTEQLVSQGYAEKTGEFNVLQITQKGWTVLKGLETPKLLQPVAANQKVKLKTKSSYEWAGVDNGLFDELRQLRREIANEKEVPAFVVFSDAALRDMARIRPASTEWFRKVSGVGEKKCNEYGKTFTERIKNYCQTHSLEVNIKLGDTEKFSSDYESKPLKQTNINQIKIEVYKHFRQNKSVEAVANLIKKAESTVNKYLIEFLQEDRITDSSPWVSESIRQQILEVASASEDGRLKPMYEALNEKISYNDIRIVITCFKNLQQ